MREDYLEKNVSLSDGVNFEKKKHILRLIDTNEYEIFKEKFPADRYDIWSKKIHHEKSSKN